MTTTTTISPSSMLRQKTKELPQNLNPSIKLSNHKNRTNMMNNNKVKQQHKAVHFCEQANTERSIECNFSSDVRQALWYSQEEFQEMKTSRHQTVAQQSRSSSSSSSSCCTDETRCLRGLEKLLPQGKHVLKHRRVAIRSIVQMYRQLHVPSSCHDDDDEGDEVLRAFAISKTRYAQHTAKFVAAQDAAAVVSGSSEYCCCCKPSWQYPSVSELRISPERSHSTAVSSSETSSSPRIPPSNNTGNNKAMTVASNKRPSLQQVQRRVPMRAPTA